MGKLKNTIDEIMVYVSTMTETEKTSFKNSLGTNKSGKNISTLFKAFEKSDLKEAPSGVIKRILTIPNGTDYNTFKKFKRKLIDHELLLKHSALLKNEDRAYISADLNKDILTANLIINRRAHQTAIDILNDTYKKALKLELVDLATQSAKELSKNYEQIGQSKEYIQWQKKSMELDNMSIIQKMLSENFEKIVHRSFCCSSHDLLKSNEDLDMFILHSKSLRLENTQWMRSVAQLFRNNVQLNERERLMKSLALVKKLKQNPGLYPLSYSLITYRLILESLWILNRKIWLNKIVQKISVINRISTFESIPLLRFNLCFLLKTKNFHMLEITLNRINKNNIYQRFPEFICLSNRVELLMNLYKNDSNLVLRIYNQRMENLPVCENVNFQFRIIELIALTRLNEIVLIHDKVESLRKFIQRNKYCKESIFCSTALEILRKGMRLKNTNQEIEVPDLDSKSIYDLRGCILDQLSYSFPNLVYIKNEKSIQPKKYIIPEQPEIQQAAEKDMSSDYGLSPV